MAEVEDPEKPDTEEILMLLLHQSMRNYDLLAHLLKHFDPKSADMIIEWHEDMKTWGPPPYYT